MIPENTKVAAKRGFIRTFSQSFAGALTSGVIVLSVLTGSALVGLASALGLALVSAAISGAASYFSIIGKGVPEDYRDVS